MTEGVNMFKYIRKAQYHETDKMGIIHHSNYIKWMEEARIELMDCIGFGYKTLEESGIISPVVSISLDYRKQVFFADEIEIRVEIQKYNGIVLELKYEFYNLTRDEICTNAFSKHGFLNDGKIVSLKKVLPVLDDKINSYIDMSK